MSPAISAVGAGGTADFLCPSDYRYTPPRRESIAETISESGYSAFPIRTKEELVEDAATLKLFPSPPIGSHSMIAERPQSMAESSTSTIVTPGLFAVNSNPFGSSTAGQCSHAAGSDGPRHRRGSMESTAASVEEDLAPEADIRAIPTRVEWAHGGNKVYLTGTFCGWGKRYRLTKCPDKPGLFAVVAIPPGTHHVKFLVDGEMRTSPDIPTAVDDTGILVNYLEISADNMPPLDRPPSPDRQSAGVHKRSDSADDISPAAVAETTALRYTREIPTYLRNLAEIYPNEDSAGGSSSEYFEDGQPPPPPPPPSLPMMLQRVVLNTSNQMKDDASVLSIPNHAVLNHLATSSIKNEILAVSATTRYKKKYVTTILYKPASSSEGE